jgi:hypothetical protein
MIFLLKNMEARTDALYLLLDSLNGAICYKTRLVRVMRCRQALKILQLVPVESVSGVWLIEGIPLLLRPPDINGIHNQGWVDLTSTALSSITQLVKAIAFALNIPEHGKLHPMHSYELHECACISPANNYRQTYALTPAFIPIFPQALKRLETSEKAIIPPTSTCIHSTAGATSQSSSSFVLEKLPDEAPQSISNQYFEKAVELLQDNVLRLCLAAGVPRGDLKDLHEPTGMLQNIVELTNYLKQFN